MTLTPAYGRDYKNKAQVLDAWKSDNDFLINEFRHPYDGKPVNRSQLLAAGELNSNSHTMIRYKKNRQVITVD